VSTDSSSLGFGQQLRLLRERASLSQNALAVAATTDPGTVNRLESGKRAPVNRALLDRIAAALSLSDDERERLLGLAGHMPDSLARLGTTDPDVLLLADILSDTSIPEDEKNDLRDGLRIMARRWRRSTTAPTVVGTASTRRSASTERADSELLQDWGCWL
jgi:transcriptional regulator with XRE-family HTH domain